MFPRETYTSIIDLPFKIETNFARGSSGSIWGWKTTAGWGGAASTGGGFVPSLAGLTGAGSASLASSITHKKNIVHLSFHFNVKIFLASPYISLNLSNTQCQSFSIFVFKISWKNT